MTKKLAALICQGLSKVRVVRGCEQPQHEPDLDRHVGADDQDREHRGPPAGVGAQLLETDPVRPFGRLGQRTREHPEATQTLALTPGLDLVDRFGMIGRHVRGSPRLDALTQTTGDTSRGADCRSRQLGRDRPQILIDP